MAAPPSPMQSFDRQNEKFLTQGITARRSTWRQLPRQPANGQPAQLEFRHRASPLRRSHSGLLVILIGPHPAGNRTHNQGDSHASSLLPTTPSRTPPALVVWCRPPRLSALFVPPMYIYIRAVSTTLRSLVPHCVLLKDA